MTLPTKSELDNYAMGDVAAMFKQCPELAYLYSPAGVEHYRLLRWIGHQSHGKVIFDIGTYMGLSAGCLGYFGNNVIFTFDTSFDALKLKSPHGSILIKQVVDEHSIPERLTDANIIMVDTWHNGVMEQQIYDILVKAKWKGVLIYDDIYYNDAMKEFWAGINHPGKIDATDIGHSTGTGIIEFYVNSLHQVSK